VHAIYTCKSPYQCHRALSLFSGVRGLGCHRYFIVCVPAFILRHIHKLLKKSQGTLCPAGSVSVIQPSCCFALVHPRPVVVFVTSGQCYQPRLPCFTFSAFFWSKICCGKNAEAAENCHICQLLSVFNALSNNPELYLEHTKPLQSRLESADCMCAVLAFKFALFRQYLLGKIKGFP
jgi:hypothetical protein